MIFFGVALNVINGKPFNLDGRFKVKRSLLFLIFIAFNVQAEKVVGRKYYKNFLGHVHKNPSKDSTSLTTLQCSHSVKIIEEKNSVEGWTKVVVGEDKGYIQTDFLLDKRPDCLQSEYPKFYHALELDITEMYHWGRLYDHYVNERTRVN